MGCFYSMDINYNIFQGLILLPIQGRKYDCDCRFTGVCPAGPPPLPPLEQFMNRNTSTEIYADCELSDEFPPSGKRPNGWEVHRGWSDQPALWDPYYPDWLDDVAEDERRQQEVEEKKTGDKIKRDAFVFDSIEEKTRWAIGNVFKNLPKPKREALLRQFESLFEPDGETVDETIVKAANGKSHLPTSVAGDLAFGLSILLAEPDKHAKRVVSTFPPTTVKVLLRCTDHAMRYGLQRIQEPSTESQIAKRSDERRKFDHSNGSSVPEVEFIYQLAGRYLAHTTDAIWQWEGEMDDKRGIANFLDSSSSYYPPSHPMDLICTTVHHDAVQNAKQGRGDRYVASYPEAMMSLNRQSWSPSNHKLLNPLMANDRDWTHLNFTEANMRETLGGAFPAVVVAINFLTLSLHASAAGLLHAL